MTPITHEFRTFDVGERVSVVINPGIHYGMPNTRFQGKTGIVTGQQGRAFVVEPMTVTSSNGSNQARAPEEGAMRA